MLPALAIGSVVGGALSGIGSFLGGTKSASTSAAAAEKNTQLQLAWERERATNAHQWEVQDLEKAGLNPILSAGGGGAATGSITPQMPDTSGINSAYTGAFNAINSTISNIVQNKATIASAKKAEEEAKLTSEKTFTEKLTQFLTTAKTQNMNEDTMLKHIQGLIADEKRKQEEINTDWKTTEKWINNGAKITDRLIKVLQGAGLFSLANKFKGAEKGFKMQNGNIFNKRTGEVIW